MTDKEKPKNLSELIASTPAAQPLSDALENIRVRRKRLLGVPAAKSADDAHQPEAIPVIENPEKFASDFWERQKTKKKEPKVPKRKPTKTPYLTIVDNDDPKNKK